MAGLSTATIELREGTPGKFRLVMKTGAGKEEEVSTFTDRDMAANALRVVTSAMLTGDGSSGGGSVSSGASSGGGMLKPVLWIVGVVVVLYIAMNGILAGALHPGAGGHKLPEGIKAGTAVPADKIFGGK
jgi:hypothetical protein